MSAAPTPLELTVLGARVAVRLPSHLEPAVSAAWAACAEQPTGTAPDATLDLRAVDLDPGWLAQQVGQELIALGIEHQVGRRLMLHAACVVEETSGRGIALVGPSGAGKTTASIHLCRNGFGYITDETVALDEQRRAALFRKPLSVVEASGGPKTQHSPTALGMALGQSEPVVESLVLLSRTPGAERPSFEPVPLLDAVAEVIPETSSLLALDRPLTRLATFIDACGGARRLRYRDIADLRATDLLPDSAAAATWRSHRPSGGGRTEFSLQPTDLDAVGPDVALRRSDYVEALEHDGEVLLLAGDIPVRLQGVAATIWLLCEHPQALPNLVAGCISAHGPTPDAQALVREAARMLASSGVLVPDLPAGDHRP